MKKFLNILSRNFHIYKTSCTMFLWGLSAALSILGNTFGMLYLVLAILPILALGLLSANDRKNINL